MSVTLELPATAEPGPGLPVHPKPWGEAGYNTLLLMIMKAIMRGVPCSPAHVADVRRRFVLLVSCFSAMQHMK